MTVQLRPDMQRFVEEQVKAGRYPSVDGAVEAGLARLMLDEPDVLDERDIASIKVALEQVSRGEFFTAEQVRERFLGK